MNNNRDNEEFLAFKLRTYEAMLRIISQQHFPFMLKGSFLLARVYPEPLKRLAITEDIDFVYLKPLKDPLGDKLNFREHFYDYYAVIADELSKLTWVAESDLQPCLDNEGRYEGESYLVDYAMEDDFVTAGTTIAFCNEAKYWQDFDIEMTMNLPLFVAPESIAYQPFGGGESFVVPYAASHEVQAAWKLHQSLVRLRPKDILDLGYLLPHLTFDEETSLRLLKTVLGECQASQESERLINQLKQVLCGDLMPLKEQYQQLNRYAQAGFNRDIEEIADLIPVSPKFGSAWQNLLLHLQKAITDTIDSRYFNRLIDELVTGTLLPMQFDDIY